MNSEDVHYQRILACDVSQDLLDECAKLFCAHYGIWSPSIANSAVAGKPIRLSGNRLKDYMTGDNGSIATARLDGELIGYAISVRLPSRWGTISWVTQLVVHTDYQKQLIASRILNSIWGFSSDYAWGIVSANPYAVRALEKATRRRCNPKEIWKRRKTLIKILDRISYLRTRRTEVTLTRSVVDTKYFQDLTEVPEKIRLASQEQPWVLGDIGAGEEWLAVVFNKQKKIRWSDQEFNQFMALSNKIQADAYERMAQSRPQASHVWASPANAETEVEFLIKEMGLSPPANIVDFGCGAGRHAIALAKRGYQVEGVDFSPTAIRLADEERSSHQLPATFINADCRAVRFGHNFDAGICLYDVIGSFPDDDSNERILFNLVSHIKPGGLIALSVMSYQYIEDRIKNIRNIDTKTDIQKQLDTLQLSQTMQTSGEIFNPELTVIDPKKRVAYRKEQFDSGDSLMAEWIVRDRRYTFRDLDEMCRKFGLEKLVCGYVRAGNFDLVKSAQTSPTKEILLLARKSVLI